MQQLYESTIGLAGERSDTTNARLLLLIVATVVVGCVLRLAFFTGVFGSDEVTYLQAASRILEGDWTASDYIGSSRLGVNLPLAFMMALFGKTQFAANLYSLVTSVAELVVVVWFAYRAWGQRAALAAGLMLASLPLHVHFAGRMMADAPLAFFVTVSFLLYYSAHLRDSARLYLASGACIGVVFWIKEVSLVYSMVFVLFPLLWDRRVTWKWLLLPTAAGAVVAANSLVYLIISGNALHVPAAVLLALERTASIESASREPWLYLYYLLADVRHTFLLGPLVLAALAANVIRSAPDRTVRFVTLWFLGLLGILSLFITSLAPLTFITKQASYMLLFVAPACLLAGRFLSMLPRRVYAVLLLGVVGGNTVLAGLEQQAIHNFVANSKAAISTAARLDDSIFHVPPSVFRVNALGEYVDDVEYVEERRLARLEEADCSFEPEPRRFIVFDEETAGWAGAPASYDAIRQRIEPCLGMAAELTPMGFGAGRAILTYLIGFLDLVPDPLGQRLVDYAGRYVRPKPAHIFELKGSSLPLQPESMAADPESSGSGAGASGSVPARQL